MLDQVKSSEQENPSRVLELLLGPYRSGKSRQIIEELIELKKKDPLSNVLVLLPSSRYARLFKERLAEALTTESQKQGKGVGLLGLEIQPFYQACRNVLSSCGIEPKVLPEELRPVLLAAELSKLDNENALKSLKNIASFPGTASAALELIDELERAALSPEELIETLSLSAAADSRLSELAKVYERYWLKLHELGYYDQKMMALKSRELLFSNSPVNYDLLLIDGFDRVSSMQAQVFAGLSRLSRRCIMSFDYIAEQSRYNSLTQNPFKQKYSDYKWKEASYKEILKNFGSTELRHFSPDCGNSEKVSCKIVSLLDPYLEMKELCAQLKEAIRERKVKTEDLVVLMRSPDAYLEAIHSAFRQAGITYFIDGSSPVSQLPPWQFISSLFTIHKLQFKRKSLIDILRSPYFNLEAIGLNSRKLSILDRDSYESRLIGSLKEWEKLLQKPVYEEFACQLLKLISALELKQEKHSFKTHVKTIENIIDEYMIFPASSSDLKQLKAIEEREAIKALRRSLQSLLLQEELLSEKPETFQEFWKRLEAMIASSNYARPRPQEEAVLICSAELVPNRRFKELYLCGVLEGEFPRQHKSRGFLSQEQCRLWRSYGVEIQNPRHEAGFEEALFFSLCERAGSSLYFSYPQYLESSEEKLPSFFLNRIEKQILEFGLDCRKIEETPFASSLQKPGCSRDLIAAWLWQHGLDSCLEFASRLDKDLISQTLDYISEPFSALLQRTSRLESNYNGYLEDFFAGGILKSQELKHWTASKINDYGKCPFRFWTNHVLHLNAREEAEAGLNPALRGQFYHKVLELYFKQQKEASLESSILNQTDRERLLKDTFEQALIWLQARADFQPGPYWQQEQKDLYFRLQRFIETECSRLQADEFGFKAEIFELEFGSKDAASYPALVLKQNNGSEIEISGKIDRIDFASLSPNPASGTNQCKPDLRIIDYKSSSKRITLKDAESGRNLQLPVYALALENAVFPGQKVKMAEYLSISSGECSGRINFEAEKTASLKERAQELLLSFAAAAESGIFLVKPRGKDVCKDCPHKRVCRVSELPLQTKEQDPDACFD